MIDFLLRRLPLGAIVLLVLPFGVPSAHAASDPQSLVGVWRLTVQDKNPNRELEVLNVGVVPGGKSLLEARYGWWGGRLKRVAASLETSTSGPATMEIQTPAQARVRLKQVDETTFDGTLETRGGRTYAARLRLVSNSAPSAEERAEAQGGDGAESAPPVEAGGKLAYRPTAKIQYVYMGGNDCPPCREWRAVELPKLKATREFAQINFHYVVKSVPSPVPVGWLPEDLKALGPALLEASGGRGGSSQSAFIVDGKIADYWFGSRDAAELAAMIRAVRAGKPIPGSPCLKRNVARQCVVPG